MGRINAILLCEQDGSGDFLEVALVCEQAGIGS